MCRESSFFFFSSSSSSSSPSSSAFSSSSYSSSSSSSLLLPVLPLIPLLPFLPFLLLLLLFFLLFLFLFFLPFIVTEYGCNLQVCFRRRVLEACFVLHYTLCFLRRFKKMLILRRYNWHLVQGARSPVVTRYKYLVGLFFSLSREVIISWRRGNFVRLCVGEGRRGNTALQRSHVCTWTEDKYCQTTRRNFRYQGRTVGSFYIVHVICQGNSWLKDFIFHIRNTVYGLILFRLSDCDR